MGVSFAEKKIAQIIVETADEYAKEVTSQHSDEVRQMVRDAYIEGFFYAIEVAEVRHGEPQ